MRLIFGTSSEIEIIRDMVRSDGALCISTAGMTEEFLVREFSETARTRNMHILNEEGEVVAHYEDYVDFQGVMSYVSGVKEVVLCKLGTTIVDRIDQNENDISDLNEAIAELAGLISEVLS